MEPSTPYYYFKNTTEWRSWLSENYSQFQGIYLIFYKIETKKPSMLWEEAVKVALCFGWIDSTVKSLGNGKRQQYFCPRKPKSVWSKLNKTYIEELTSSGLMHSAGLEKVQIAKENGSWEALDAVDNLIIPEDLQLAFNKHPIAYKNYEGFAPSYRKNYLYWVYLAKRVATREKRIKEVIALCEANKKQR
ncbi:YdeI/OmpD-associated family protein [Tenacibaculum sp. 190524A02b]|uniref:YdeI/OmpD-associated family protein n=1 Tax=Tenacibaculum vairaonense TaxID=3137860 RepID=UPI0031FAEEEE